MVARTFNTLTQLAWKMNDLIWIPLVLCGGTLIGRGLSNWLSI
ncbi:MAG TPA: hypothetical protein VHB46_09255 [Burkholderiales bacterium]|nr:hypothetical protein [Burkholderiales bacterium]